MISHKSLSDPLKHAVVGNLFPAGVCRPSVGPVRNNPNGKGLKSDDIKDIKCRPIVKTLTRPGLNALKEAYRRRLVIALPFLVNHLVEQGFLILQEDLAICEEGDGSRAIIKARYAITP